MEKLPETKIATSPWLESKRRRLFIGRGFEYGLTLGSAYYFLKGFNYMSKNQSYLTRFRTGFNTARVNAVRTAGLGAAICFTPEAVANVILYYRPSLDPWTTFASCAAAAAVCTASRGPKVCSFSALGVGAYFGCCHHFVNKMLQKEQANKKKIEIPSLKGDPWTTFAYCGAAAAVCTASRGPKVCLFSALGVGAYLGYSHHFLLKMLQEHEQEQANKKKIRDDQD